jgi:hypothetical protein
MVEKLMHCIWIGDDSKRPDKWIQTWKDAHPEWEYRIWGNYELKNYQWHNKELMQSYLNEKRYPAVADIMRYKILYEHGGMVHPADSVCINSVDDLFINADAFAVYENEKVRPGLISPLYAAKKNSQFAFELINNLPKIAPKAKDGKNKAPWQVTGNLYMQRMVNKTNANVKVLPSYTFTPVHYTGDIYRGSNKVYAVQMWGTTGSWLGKEIDYLHIWNNRDKY